MPPKEHGFYVGKDMEGKEFRIEPQTLTKHAIVLGATGSGKTVICKAVIEEAAFNGVPILAIDPKGDISCLAISSLDFSFRPWCDVEADSLRRPREEYAEALKKLYFEKTSSMGIGSHHIKEFMENVEVRIFTPKSSAGIPLSISPRLDAPPQFARLLDEDPTTATDLLEITVRSILNIIKPRRPEEEEHQTVSYLSSILEHEWKEGKGLEINSLMDLVLNPPFEKIGNLPVDQVFSSKDRMRLAGELNLFNTHPRLRSWVRGSPIDFDRLFHTVPKTPINVVDLRGIQSQEEKIFFVETLLQQLYNWVLKKEGVQNLRFLLYFDEVMGYCPPVREPPSKKAILLLIKQARAFGLGLILATQNPIDLDYKVISNANVRFIGRLATERDIERVRVGLDLTEDAEETIGRLKASQFFYQVFDPRISGSISPRWLFTYHRGPLADDEISVLMAELKAAWVPGMMKAVSAAKEKTMSAEMVKPAVSFSGLPLLEPIQTYGRNHFDRSLQLRNTHTMNPVSIEERILLQPLYRVSASVTDPTYTKSVFEFSLDLYAEDKGFQTISFPTRVVDPLEVDKVPMEQVSIGSEADSSLKEHEGRAIETTLGKARMKIDEEAEKSEREIQMEYDVKIRELRDKMEFMKREMDSKNAQIEGLKKEIREAGDEVKKRKGRREPTARLTQQILSKRTKIAEINQAIIRDGQAFDSLEAKRKELTEELSNELSSVSKTSEKTKASLMRRSSSKRAGWFIRRLFQGAVMVNGREHVVSWDSLTGRITWKACHQCGIELEKGFACDCGNLACESHVSTCSECGRETCLVDSRTCANCGKAFCLNHEFSPCSLCGKLLCAADSTVSRCSCGKVVCEAHDPYCQICGKARCPEHSFLCARCSRKVGPEHSIRCHECGRDHCTQHAKECQKCGEPTCEGCVGKRPLLGFIGELLCKSCAL